MDAESPLRNVQLTSPVVSDAQVCRGQVDVHFVLEDLLEEALSLPKLELLRWLHVWRPLGMLRLCWESQDAAGQEVRRCCSTFPIYRFNVNRSDVTHCPGQQSIRERHGNKNKTCFCKLHRTNLLSGTVLSSLGNWRLVARVWVRK